MKKIYLSSYRIPAPDELEAVIDKPLRNVKLALIPNAKDYYADRARNLKIDSYVTYFKSYGIKVDIVDLRDFHTHTSLVESMSGYDIVWAIGGNTFCLRYEMRRSGFELAIDKLLESGVVYGGDSAGALVAGPMIGGLGIEVADTPEFAEAVIPEGLSLVPYIIIPHADNPDFMEITRGIRDKAKPHKVIELGDSQAVIFYDAEYHVVSENE